MKLSPLQRRIIPLVQFKPQAPLSELAGLLRSQVHTVRYALNQLIEGGVLQLVPYVNRPALGYLDYHVFFSLREGRKEKRDLILQKLVQAPGTVFLSETGGDFQYQLIVAAKTPDKVLELLESINQGSTQIIWHKKVAISARYAPYAKKYFGKTYGHTQELKSDASFLQTPLDELNIKILRELSNKTFQSLRDTARKLGIAYATLHSRITWLEKHAVLLGFYFDVEPLAYGFQDYILLLYGNSVSKKDTDSLFKFCEEHPNFSYATSMLGEWDYEFGIEVENPEDIVPVVQQFSQTFGDTFSESRLMLRFRALSYRPFPF